MGGSFGVTYRSWVRWDMHGTNVLFVRREGGGGLPAWDTHSMVHRWMYRKMSGTPVCLLTMHSVIGSFLRIFFFRNIVRHIRYCWFCLQVMYSVLLLLYQQYEDAKIGGERGEIGRLDKFLEGEKTVTLLAKKEGRTLEREAGGAADICYDKWPSRKYLPKTLYFSLAFGGGEGY